MELLLMVTTLLGGLVAFDVLSIHRGADSRDRIGDDWARSARR